MLFGKRWARVSRFLGVFGVVLVVALAARSQAITWGTIDTSHPNVGAILTQHADGTFGEFCSGTLVSARVFLTAGHCTDALVSRAFPVSRLRVSFAPNIFAEGAVYLEVSGYQSHPDYRWGPTSDPHDLGVLILAKAAAGVAFGVPAPANYLDGLAAAGAIQDAKFINVGYGDNQEFVVTGDRQISYSSFRNLHDAWLYMSQNIHHEDGGTCYGDSGVLRRSVVPRRVHRRDDKLGRRPVQGDEQQLPGRYRELLGVHRGDDRAESLDGWQPPGLRSQAETRRDSTNRADTAQSRLKSDSRSFFRAARSAAFTMGALHSAHVPPASTHALQSHAPQA